MGAVQENHDEDPELRVLSSAEGPAAVAAKKGILASRQVRTFVLGAGFSFQSSCSLQRAAGHCAYCCKTQLPLLVGWHRILCVSPCTPCSSALMSSCLSLACPFSLAKEHLRKDEPSKNVRGCLRSVNNLSAVRQGVSDAVATFVRELRAGGPHAPGASEGPSAPTGGPARGAPAAARPQQATGSQAPPPMAAKPAAKVRRQLQSLPTGTVYSSRVNTATLQYALPVRHSTALSVPVRCDGNIAMQIVYHILYGT